MPRTLLIPSHKVPAQPPRFAGGMLGCILAGLGILALLAADCRGQAAMEMRRGQIKLPPKSSGPVAVAFSPDGKLLAVSTRADSVIHIFDVAAAKPRLRLQFPGQNNEYHYVFSPDGRRLVSCGQEDDMIRIFDLVTGKQVREFKKPPDFANFLSFSPDGKRMAFQVRNLHDLSTNLHALKVVDVDTEKVVWHMQTPATPDRGPPPLLVVACAFSPQGKTVAVQGIFGQVLLLDSEKGTVIRQLRENYNAGSFKFVTYSPDGKHLATGGHCDRFLHIWDVATGKERLKVDASDENGWYYSAAFSPDGSLLVYAGDGHGHILYDLLNGKELCKLPDDRGGVFSPDGSLLAVPGNPPGNEPVITLYNMPTGRNGPLPRNLSEAQLEGLWNELRTDNDFRLQRVLASLSAATDDAVVFLGKKLSPVPDEQGRRVKAALTDLGAKDPKTRAKAMEAMRELAASFEPLLTEASKNQEPGEARNLIRSLLPNQRYYGEPTTALQVQMLAVTVLEQIGTDQAKRVLTALANGAAGATLTEEARQALARLSPAQPKR